jgi:hypothetical protein
MGNTQDKINQRMAEVESVLVQFSTKTTKALCAAQPEEK